MVSKIAMILELLSDGKWHDAEELTLKLGLNEQKIQEVTEFLNKYNLVYVDEENRKIRINKDFKKLLTQTIT